MTDVKFGSKLERIKWRVFSGCVSLDRITIPLKDGLIPHRDTFGGCENLKHVDLVEELELQETIDALLQEEWRSDMNEEIDSINEILLYAYMPAISSLMRRMRRVIGITTLIVL